MGNIFSDDSSTSPFFQKEKFVQVALKQEPLYGEVRIMSSTLVPDYYIVYQTLLFSRKEDFFSKSKSLELYKRNPHPNILTLLDFHILENEGLCACGSFLRVQIAYELLTRTLAEDFSYKIQMRTYYKEDEVWLIMKCVFKGLSMIYCDAKNNENMSFVNMDLLLLEGMDGDLLENIRLLNPNLNRKGGLYEENVLSSNENKLRNEVFSLGKICLKLLLLENINIDERSLEFIDKIDKTKYSTNIIDFIRSILQLPDENYISIQTLLFKLEKSEKNTRNYEKNESFLWYGIELPDSNDSFTKKQGLDISHIDFMSASLKDRKRNEFFDEGEDTLQPILNLNYNSPEKKRSNSIVWKEFGKENWDFGKFGETYNKNY